MIRSGFSSKRLRVTSMVAVIVAVAVIAIRGTTQTPSASAAVSPPIGPLTAQALGITINPATDTASMSDSAAEQVALAGWHGCTTNGATTYAMVDWESPSPPIHANVFLVPISCPWGNDASIPEGGGASLNTANYRIALVSPMSGLLMTISGVSADPSPTQ